MAVTLESLVRGIPSCLDVLLDRKRCLPFSSDGSAVHFGLFIQVALT